MKEIYQQTAEEVLERVESRGSGLTDEQVRRSREKCGWNELAEGKKKSILQIFFSEPSRSANPRTVISASCIASSLFHPHQVILQDRKSVV